MNASCEVFKAVVDGQLGDRAIVESGHNTVYIAGESDGEKVAAMLSPKSALEFAAAVIAAAKAAVQEVQS